MYYLQLMEKQRRFINPRTDFGFKRIFGDEEILLAFLNDLFEGETHFKSLTFTDKEVKGFTPDNRTIIYDIHCLTDDDKKVIIEMQNDGNDSFRDRMLYYTARDIVTQGDVGKGWNYDDLNAVYSIFILNFKLFKDKGPQYLRHDIKLIDITTNRQFTDKMRMICLQLPLTITNESRKSTRLDTWMYNLNNMEEMQNLAYTEEMPIFKKLERIAEYSNLTREERVVYEQSFKAYMDEQDRRVRMARTEERMAKAEERIAKAEERVAKAEECAAKAEERAEHAYEDGKAKGITETQLDMAKRLKSMGVGNDIIASASNLSIEEIEQL